MKSIVTKVRHYGDEKQFNELTDWMEKNVGPYYKAWDRFAFGKFTEIIVWDDRKATLVALRWG